MPGNFQVIFGSLVSEIRRLSPSTETPAQVHDLNYSLFAESIATECISDHNDTNKRSNCLN